MVLSVHFFSETVNFYTGGKIGCYVAPEQKLTISEKNGQNDHIDRWKYQ
jgi:hypothetical protein